MKKHGIVQDGRLTVPLFHGTSSLYFDSIMRFGLGGRDVVNDMGIRETARFLLSHCDPDRANENWSCSIDGCRNVGADPRFDRLTDNSGFSFRYGGTYVSASFETAATYALGQGMKGGEALNEVLTLARLLSEHIPGIYGNERVAILTRFAENPATPMLVEARDVEVACLRSEQGGSILESLARIESASCEEDFYASLVQQENFELTSPIPSGQLRFFTPTKLIEYDEIGCSREVLSLAPFVPAITVVG